MKKVSTLIFLVAFFATSMLHAAVTWDSPSYKSESPTSGTTYFVYNVGSSGFLNRGANWATMACVTAKPRANASASVNMWTCVNTSGTEWTLQYNTGGSDVSGQYLYAKDESNGNLYTDNTTNNTFNVVEVDATNHIYTFQILSSLANYDANNYIGTESATESTNKGIANPVRHNRTSNDDYIKWKFISQDNYDLYAAKIVLDRYMRYADARGDITLTSYISTYNSDVTADINTASANLLTELGRTDVTDSITNSGFETGDFTGWTNSDFATQSNSPNGTGMTKAGTYYAEKWTSYGSNLSARTITQTISGLTNGMYELVMNGHAVQQNGSNPLHTGAFVTCGSSSTEVSAGDDYIVDLVSVSNGSLTIGYKLEGSIACNWTGFDNFRLYYYGAPAVSSDATLSGISIGTGTLRPAFSSGTTSYYVTLPTGTTSVNVNATRASSAASFTINGNSASDGVNQAVAISSGTGTATIVVTAEDGSTQETYTVNFKNLDKKHSYTFADGTADDQVGSVDGTTSGAKISIADGACTVSSASGSTDGYVSFSGTDLALNGYESITLEAYIKAGSSANTSYTMLSYFGSSSAGSQTLWIQPTRGDGTYSRAETNNGSTTVTSQTGTELDDGSYHHVVAILNDVSLDYYIDGSLATSSTTGGDYISTIGTDVAYLFKGQWSDPNYNASIYEFNIYEGTISSSVISSNSTSFVGAAHDATLSNITVGGSSLSGFSSSTYTYEVQLEDGASVPTVVGVNNDSNGSNSVSNAGSVPGSTVITSYAEDGKTLKTYTLNFVYVSDDATLSDISVGTGTLSPTFSSGTTSYTVTLPVGTSSVNVNATRSSSAASFTINSTSASDGVNQSISLTNGTGTATIDITAEDGTTTAQYTIAFSVEENYAISLPGSDGSSSNIDISGLALTTLPYTVEMWVKPDGDQAAYAGLLYNRGTSNGGLCYAAGWQGTNLLRMDHGGNFTSSAVSVDTWHHVAVVVTSTTQYIYIDGSQAGTTTGTFSAFDYTDGNTYIGYDAAVTSRAFKGLIDEVRVWSTARTVSELEAYKYTALTGSESGLVAYYNFDDKAATATDLTSNNNDGTITGGSYVASFNRRSYSSGAWVSQTPSSTSNVVVKDGTLSLTSNTEYGTLTIDNGAVTRVAAGNVLAATTINNNAGASGLILQSTASGTAMLNNNSSGVQATVKQFLPKDKWHYVGLPFTNSYKVEDIYGGLWVSKSDESLAAASSTAGWVTLTAGDDILPGVGYALYQATNDTTISVEGTLNTGSVNPTLAHSNEGWNLICNPYPISIDWTTASTTNVNNAIYLYDASAGTYGSYVNGTGANGQTQHIPPMQAFFIQSNAGSPVLGFSNSSKTTQAVDFKSASVNSTIRLSVSDNNGRTDETVLVEKASATASFDNTMDAYKLIASASKAPQIYTELDIKYSINALPSFDESTMVPLRILAKEDGEHKISVNLENVNAQMPVLLLDAENNLLADLTTDDYQLELTADEEAFYTVAFSYNALKAERLALQNVKLKVENRMIRATGLDANSRVDVYSLAGQKVASLVANDDSAEIEMSQLGVFVVKVRSMKGESFTGKVVIK